MADGELVASDAVTTEKLYAVLRENSRDLSDTDVSMCRLSDANMERLSCGPLTSVEFNRAYPIVMTTSIDTTMALFSVGIRFLCNAYLYSVKKVRKSFVGGFCVREVSNQFCKIHMRRGQDRYYRRKKLF